MKRDMDLIRKILLAVEATPSQQDFVIPENLNIEGFDANQINYNMLILLEAGYLVGITQSYDDETHVMVKRLTWAGHEFLDAARDDKRWEKVKDTSVKIGGLAFDVVKALLIDLSRQTALRSLGIIS